MKTGEFIEKYCKDIVAKAEIAEDLDDDIEFSYDAIVQGDDGEETKVIFAGNTEIPIVDILTLSDSDFKQTYPAPEAYVAYKHYLESFIILEGEEALQRFRMEIEKSRERIEKYASLDLDNILCSFTK